MFWLDLAGVPQPGGLSGHSLIPLVSGVSAQSAEPHPGWVLSEYHGCNANASTYMLRIGEWKYITYADGLTVPPQLFSEFLLMIALLIMCNNLPLPEYFAQQGCDVLAIYNCLK